MANIVKNWAKQRSLVEKLLTTPGDSSYEPLTHIVEEILARKEEFLSVASSRSLPCYVFDKSNLARSAKAFSGAFTTAIPNSKSFYAVKVNHYKPLLEYVFSNGFGADVSSGRELALSLEAGAKNILFSGPGKTVEELQLALKNSNTVILNVDSFGELKKLETLCVTAELSIKIGIRVSLKEQGSWSKFGIPLEELNTFFIEAKKIKGLVVCGIQFHSSWNRDASPYALAIQKIASYLKHDLHPDFLSVLEFIDLGGGFRPYRAEGYYPEDTPLGAAIQAACDEFDEDPDFTTPFLVTKSVPIDEYAHDIGRAVDDYLRPLGTFDYYLEPGRIICNDSMHVIVRIEDIKSPQCIITNGGTNIIGFERFEFDYFPIINLTHPSLVETPCMVYGCLCMPQDYWGQTIYSSRNDLGDILVIPYQGALTYANMQSFIKGEAPVHELKS